MPTETVPTEVESTIALPRSSEAAETFTSPLTTIFALGLPPNVRPDAAPTKASTCAVTCACATTTDPSSAPERLKASDFASACTSTRSPGVPASSVSPDASRSTPSRT